MGSNDIHAKKDNKNKCTYLTFYLTFLPLSERVPKKKNNENIQFLCYLHISRFRRLENYFFCFHTWFTWTSIYSHSFDDVNLSKWITNSTEFLMLDTFPKIFTTFNDFFALWFIYWRFSPKITFYLVFFFSSSLQIIIKS